MNNRKSATPVFSLPPRFLEASTCCRLFKRICLILTISMGFWPTNLSAKSNSNSSVLGVFVGSCFYQHQLPGVGYDHQVTAYQD